MLDLGNMTHSLPRTSFALCRMALLTCALTAGSNCVAQRTDGKLVLRVVDEQTKVPIAVRLELRDARDRLVRINPPESVVAADGVYFTGETTLALRRGNYTLMLEAGPEYQTFFTQPGTLEIVRGADDAKDVAMMRRVDMRREGWYAGDLDVRLPAEGLATVMAARGVDVAPVAVAVNELGRCRRPKTAAGAAAPTTVRYEGRGGGLLLVGGDTLPDVCDVPADGSLLAPLAAARKAGAAIVAMRADAWALPVWIASGKLDAVQIMSAEGSPTRRGNRTATATESSRPRDLTLFPGKTGPGRYAESIYHRLLDCGLRIVPAAGTGAGDGGEMSLGANRVYVRCGDDVTPADWLAGLRAGHVTVTNGPLLRTSVDGRPPGHLFEQPTDGTREYEVALNLAFYAQTHIEYLEIVKDGRVIHNVRLDELAGQGGRLPKVPFDASGWFAVRAVTSDLERRQFATSGAYFVQAGEQPRISRESVEFFRTWLDELAAKFVDDAAVQAGVAAARPFWDGLRARANVC